MTKPKTTRRRQGRPSLTGRARNSPTIAFRVPPRQMAQLERAAAEAGLSCSAVARAALAAWLERHA